MSFVRRAAVVLALLSVSCWLASYSWLLGLEPPTRTVLPGVSPWWLAEAAAVPLGAGAVVLGLVGARRASGLERRVSRSAAIVAGAAAVLALLSLLTPA